MACASRRTDPSIPRQAGNAPSLPTVLRKRGWMVRSAADVASGKSGGLRETLKHRLSFRKADRMRLDGYRAEVAPMSRATS
jgi:hypothetical protein